MRFGPLNPLDLDRLKGTLDSHQVKYSVEVSKEDLDVYKQRRLMGSQTLRYG